MPVEKLPSGKWRAVAHLGGQRLRGEARDTRREAMSDVARLQVQLEDALGTVRRRRTARVRHTVADLVDRFIAGKDYSPTTQKNVEAG